jgi:hypothetical protein
VSGVVRSCCGKNKISLVNRRVTFLIGPFHAQENTSQTVVDQRIQHHKRWKYLKVVKHCFSHIRPAAFKKSDYARQLEAFKYITIY